ncbi:ash family protein [Salmonella enterica subsp. enterica serovar Durban]|nr:ash family protein [Salmonella enterica subsp. enterica serovar Durban]EIL6508962.1 ash family protein [Salmonella enterica]EJS7203105.1 ash family protein [Salmonella enterica]
MCLIKMLTGCYIFPAVTVLTAGRCNPLQLPATIGAVSAFFVVATIFAIVRHFMARCIHTGCTAYQIVVHSRMYRVTMSMVAQAGPTSVGPVSGNAGIATPVWAIASERCNSSDSMKFMLPEAAIMATTPTPKHPKSAIPQLSYDCRRKLHRAQMVVFHLYVLNMDGDEKTMQLHIPYVLSYIHDDIKAVNKELISLGLFDKAMGKKRRK